MVRKLDHKDLRRSVSKDRDSPRRDILSRGFFRLGAAVGLVAGLGCMSQANANPPENGGPKPVAEVTAKPPVTAEPPEAVELKTVRVKGVKVEVVELVDTIEKLDKETEKRYKRGKGVNPDGSHGFTVNIPNEFSAAITLRPDVKDGQNSFGVLYPKNGQDKEVEVWERKINKFVQLIKEVTKQDLRNVRLIIERTEDPDKKDPVISAYALPLDSNDNIIGKYNGGYLAYGASYYPERGVVYGGRALLVEPGNGKSLAMR